MTDTPESGIRVSGLRPRELSRFAQPARMLVTCSDDHASKVVGSRCSTARNLSLPAMLRCDPVTAWLAVDQKIGTNPLGCGTGYETP